MSSYYKGKIGNQMDGWHAIEYHSFVQVYDPLCQPYMRLYKKSTQAAAQKARHFIDQMNGEDQNTISDLKASNRQAEKDAQKLQFDMAGEITKLKSELDKAERISDKLIEEKGQLQTTLRVINSQFQLMRNVIENQSVALRNVSSYLEK